MLPDDVIQARPWKTKKHFQSNKKWALYLRQEEKHLGKNEGVTQGYKIYNISQLLQWEFFGRMAKDDARAE
jgi:hypothetical protein